MGPRSEYTTFEVVHRSGAVFGESNGVDDFGGDFA